MAELSDFLNGEIEQPDWLKELEGNPILTYQNQPGKYAPKLAIYFIDTCNNLWILTMECAEATSISDSDQKTKNRFYYYEYCDITFKHQIISQGTIDYYIKRIKEICKENKYDTIYLPTFELTDAMEIYDQNFWPSKLAGRYFKNGIDKSHFKEPTQENLSEEEPEKLSQNKALDSIIYDVCKFLGQKPN